MNRFVGLSLMCLMFLSAQAKSGQGESEFRGSSWSLQMSQNNDEPIKVKSERKEYDKTGVTLHRRSQGIIENGVYKPVSEQDLNDLSWKGDRDIDSLLRIADQYENEKNERKDFRKNEKKARSRGFFGFGNKEDMPQVKRHHPGGIFGHGFGNGENMPQMKNHPRRYGHRPMKFAEKPQRSPQEFAWREQRHPMPADQAPDNMKDRLKNRSRVSFYRPVEKLFEKIFGIKKQNDKKREDFERSPLVRRSAKPHFAKKTDRNPPRRGGWFEDFDRQNRAETQELWKNVREFEDSFFDDEYFDAEE